MSPNNEDEDGDTNSGVSDDLMIGETKGVPEERKTYPLNSKVASILASFSTESLNSEGLQKRLRYRQMNSKHLDDLESEELDERQMTRKLKKILSVGS